MWQGEAPNGHDPRAGWWPHNKDDKISSLPSRSITRTMRVGCALSSLRRQRVLATCAPVASASSRALLVARSMVTRRRAASAHLAMRHMASSSSQAPQYGVGTIAAAMAAAAGGGIGIGGGAGRRSMNMNW